MNDTSCTSVAPDLISIVVPAYNEADGSQNLIDACQRFERNCWRGARSYTSMTEAVTTLSRYCDCCVNAILRSRSSISAVTSARK